MDTFIKQSIVGNENNLKKGNIENIEEMQVIGHSKFVLDNPSANFPYP